MSTATSGSVRGRALPALAPALPPGRIPLCEDCGEAQVELYCECCAQELCRSCWAEGDNAFCGTCRGRAWDDVPPEPSAVPSGLLLGDEELATRTRR
jgi:hypothetical protein